MISKFWDGTQSFLGGEQAAIPHLKEHIQGFHMNPNAIIFISKIGLFRVNYTSKPGAPRMFLSLKLTTNSTKFQIIFLLSKTKEYI